jgi:hypothetical protein
MPEAIGKFAAHLAGVWRAHFFPLTTPVRLAAMRIFLLALQLTWFRPWARPHFQYLDNAHFIEPQLPMQALMWLVPESIIRTPAFISGLLWTATLTGIVALVGLFTRPAMLLTAAAHLLLVSHRYSYGEIHHSEALFLIALCLLALAPCGRCFSIDSWWHRRRNNNDPASAWGPYARSRLFFWPIRLTQWLVAVAYLEAAFAKLTVGGLYWMNGYTLQQYLLTDGIRWGQPLGVWLAQYHNLAHLLSMGTVAFELSFFVILFRCFKLARWLTPAYLLGGLIMHTAIFLLQSAPFWPLMSLYAMWLPLEKWGPAIGRRPRPGIGAPRALRPATQQPG